APWAAGVAVSPVAGRGAWAPASGMAYAVPGEPTIEIWSSPWMGPATSGLLVRSIATACLGPTFIVCAPLVWKLAVTPEPGVTVTWRGRTVAPGFLMLS